MQYDFPKQDTIIQFVIDAIEAFNTKTLFLIGTYTIGEFFELPCVLFIHSSNRTEFIKTKTYATITKFQSSLDKAFF